MTNEINFKHNDFGGEMLSFERFKLYTWICELSPKIIFEVGTGDGGGSTYYISKAIADKNINSQFYTCDPNRSPNDTFLKEFKFVTYYKNNSHEMLKNLTNEKIKPNFIMFDGPENPEVAYNDIIFLESYIDDGTYFCMHDWDHYRPYDKNYSTKSIKIREYLENSDKWILIEQLHSDKKNSDFNDDEFDSVGLCLYKYKK
jgi:hypothetical protein